MHAAIRRYIVASGREADATKPRADGEMIGVSVFDSREASMSAIIS